MAKDAPFSSSEQLHHAINLRLSLLGCPTIADAEAATWTALTAPIFARHREITRQLRDRLSPADGRLQHFLNTYLADTGPAPQLPARTFVLDEPGLARELSLPAHGDEFSSPLLKSYRLRNGVLHNPANDRRTTKGAFHVAEGGLPVPDDKLAVPKATFARLLELALRPPAENLRVPFTAGGVAAAECWVTLLLRSLVVPEVPGFTPEKRMEIRFFAPGSLVANLDFVESIFGNAGDPHLPENDAGLDVEGWTGHTGGVILAPHLTSVPKHLVGLPHWDLATPRQRRDGMCWKTEDELYNGGTAFKLCARDARGVIVTIIADNYFGYCKKEVKAQISYAANLYGSVEEEHAGGALVFPRYDLGEEFSGDLHVQKRGHSYAEVAERYGAVFDLRPEGYAVDREFSDIIYVPEDVNFDLPQQRVSWQREGGVTVLPLRSGWTYVRPSGYCVHIEQPPGGHSWRLVGTVAAGTFCHKPCTVSGGGKSEISKAITDAILPGAVFVADFDRDFDHVEELIQRDYSDRFRDPARRGSDCRLILSAERSLGSVIKLLTPSEGDYTDEFNAWLEAIPQYLKEIVFVVKRHSQSSWGERWREHFSVDRINGKPAHELKCDNRKLVANFLRVGYEADGSWRVFGLREDFHPAAKVQMEDDISASVVVPAGVAGLAPGDGAGSLKFVANCERRLFQRPDEAVHRGYDKQTELEIAEPGNFLSNFAPLTRADAAELHADAVGFVKFSPPMQSLICAAESETGPDYFVCSAMPRIVDGKPSKNPRYLQLRPDLARPREAYLAQMAARLNRRLLPTAPLYTPVDAVVPGRRNNPPEPKANIRPLAVFNPIHYLELPELFMEFISSMTGKSPSTTGAGSEGALTKGPFNALPAVIDLNAALVSLVLTEHDVFISAAGYVGPKVRVDHDVSLLIPEVWCRMKPEERAARHLIAEGYLERCRDFEFEGRVVRASRLGYRITSKFARTFFGRVFNHPHMIFTDEMLQPERQDRAVFSDGMENMCTTHQRVAESYIGDGTIELACPPLRALLEIMARGQTAEGHGLDSPEVRGLFAREAVLASAWYAARLEAKQRVQVTLWQRHVQSIDALLDRPEFTDVVVRLGLEGRLAKAKAELARTETPAYRAGLVGTIGVQPLAQA